MHAAAHTFLVGTAPPEGVRDGMASMCLQHWKTQKGCAACIMYRNTATVGSAQATRRPKRKLIAAQHVLHAQSVPAVGMCPSHRR
jgi:hypothetical protein